MGRENEKNQNRFETLLRGQDRNEGLSQEDDRNNNIDRERKENPAPSERNNVDDIEFLFNPEDGIFSYRAASRQSIYIYPLQQPIADRKLMDQRLNAIKDELGWELESNEYSSYLY